MSSITTRGQQQEPQRPQTRSRETQQPAAATSSKWAKFMQPTNEDDEDNSEDSFVTALGEDAYEVVE